jgi:glycerol-3-phosphate dehydrogenase
VTHWTKGWRDQVWAQLSQEWDVLIVGGGITGAGILRQCRHAGLRAVLVDAHDFAAGTSSRSSKLVHGGLRYLKNLQIKVTLESVTEREHLLKQGRGLVERLDFLYPRLASDTMPGWLFLSGLMVYDLMARQWAHRSFNAEEVYSLCPQLSVPGVRGGYLFYDAGTDDARLVLRLLRESAAAGATALNYARVDALLRGHTGQVYGALVSDTSGIASRQAEIRARVVISATGVWGDQLRGKLGHAPRLRPLRGSHLVIPFNRLPLTQAVMFMHPKDRRPVFVIPWQGAIICGTTDVDHGANLAIDPAASESEKEYLLSGVRQVFPALELTAEDVTATFAGLRPVVNTGKVDPSKESREHAIWDEDRLITASGGKLTTFRVMARDVLKAAAKYLGRIPFDRQIPVLDPIPPDADAPFGATGLNAEQCLRLPARYGAEAAPMLCSSAAELEPIPGTEYLWAELRHAARAEGVVHLDDLLLRRVRLGLLLPRGGQDLMSRIRGLVQSELGWSNKRWQSEVDAYIRLWQDSYSFA